MPLIGIDLPRVGPQWARPLRARINRASRQAYGLTFWSPCGLSGEARDYAGGAGLLSLMGGAGPTATPDGLGLDCSGTERGAVITTPAAVRDQLAFTTVWTGYVVSTASGFGPIFNLSYTTTDTSPFDIWSICWDAGGGTFRISYNVTSTPKQLSSGISPGVSAATLRQVVGTFASGAQAIYVDGQLANTASDAGLPGTSSGSQIGIGYYVSGTGRSSGVVTLDARIYNRVLSAAEVAALYTPTTRWDLYQAPSTRVFFDVSAAASFQAAWAARSNVILQPGVK